MDVNTEELTTFVGSVMESIGSLSIDLRRDEHVDNPAQGKYHYYTLKSSVKFDISIFIKKTGKAKMSLLLAQIGGNYEKETLSQISFQMDSLANINSEKANERRKSFKTI